MSNLVPRTIIKLPRSTVQACKRDCRRSFSFSHGENLEGRRVCIYCTVRGKIADAFIGVVKKVSSKSRKWSVFAESVAPKHILNSIL